METYIPVSKLLEALKPQLARAEVQTRGAYGSAVASAVRDRYLLAIADALKDATDGEVKEGFFLI